jgi:hypothetical protein
MLEIIKICKIHGSLTIEQLSNQKCGVSFRLRCKQCIKDYLEKTKEKRIAYSREYEKTKRKRPEGHYEKYVKKASREWRQRNADKVNEKIREDRKVNQEKYLNYERKWRNENLEKARSFDILKKHNITFDEYTMMREKQKGLCAICGEKEKRKSRTKGEVCRLVVDHHHASGNIRDLLCHNCNQIIGHSKESIIILKAAIAYLEKHNTKTL